MRIAALIIGLVLSVVTGIQSLALFAASSISDSLEDKTDPSSTTSAGALGALAAFLMFIAAAFAMAKPKVATWIFGAATAFWVFAALAGGFSDAWIWAAATAGLAAMSHRGIGEQQRQRDRQRAELRADLVASLNEAQA
jgi:hypothetical protein